MPRTLIIGEHQNGPLVPPATIRKAGYCAAAVELRDGQLDDAGGEMATKGLQPAAAALPKVTRTRGPLRRGAVGGRPRLGGDHPEVYQLGTARSSWRTLRYVLWFQ